jgi:8-oxo-dGTP pyrophosphatase MutT (NUDIX family)
MHQRGPGCRDYQGTWDWGGGGVEYGESLEEAIHREVNEEYGCDAVIEKALPVCEFIEASNHWVIHNHIVYIADPSSVYTTEPDKVVDIRWFPIDELPHDTMHPGCAADWRLIKDDVYEYLTTYMCA